MVCDFLSVNLNFVLPLIRILCKCSNFVLSLIRSLLLTSPNGATILIICMSFCQTYWGWGATVQRYVKKMFRCVRTNVRTFSPVHLLKTVIMIPDDRSWQVRARSTFTLGILILILGMFANYERIEKHGTPNFCLLGNRVSCSDSVKEFFCTIFCHFF